MQLGYLGYETQYQIRAADGTLLWQGTAIVGHPRRFINTGLTNILAGAGVTFDNTNPVSPDTPGRFLVLGRDDNLSTNDPISVNIVGKNVASATDGPFIGVAMEPVAQTPPGNPATQSTGTELGPTPTQVPKYGLCAGPGSICSVRTTSGAIAVKAAIGGSGTVGLCATVTTADGIVLGKCIKAASQMGSSGNYMAGVLVNPI